MKAYYIIPSLDIDIVQEACVYTANSLRLTHEKALCEWFRNLSKRNVVRAAAVVELNSNWLNRFTRTRVSDDSLNCFY